MNANQPASPEGAPSIASFFIVIATDHPGMSEVRARVRPLHRIWLREHPGHAIYVVHGGPLLDTQGAMDGTLLVVQAAHIDDVHAFVDLDPYVQAGLFDDLSGRTLEWTLISEETSGGKGGVRKSRSCWLACA